MDRRMLTALAAVVVVLAGAAALGAEAVGREVTVSQLDNEKYLPAVAYNVVRQEFLVVWHNSWGGLRDISGARLDRFGKVLSSFNIATGANDRVQPAVAYDLVRDRYLVVYVYDYFGDGTDWDLRGRLVPWYGPDAGLTEFTIYDADDSQWNPRVAYSTGDDEFLVVWGNTATGVASSISLRYVLADGTPDYAGTLAGDGTNHYLNPALAYSQQRDEYLVAYEVNQLDVAVRRMDHTGLLASQVMVANWPDAESRPAVAACPGQDQWLVVWQNSLPDVYARFLFGDGTVDGGPLAVTTMPGADDTVEVSCLPGGAQYLVAWEGEFAGGLSGILGRRLGANKVFLAPEFGVRPVFGGQTRNALNPAVVGSFLGWSVSWVQEREGSTHSDIHAAMVWAVFADDFETGNTALWSVVAP